MQWSSKEITNMANKHCIVGTVDNVTTNPRPIIKRRGAKKKIKENQQKKPL